MIGISFGHADHMRGSVLVLDPKGQQFEPGHGHFSNWLVRVSADRMTNSLNIAVCEPGQGVFVPD
jgi:hypothetical protein